MLIFGGSVNRIPWAYVPEILPPSCSCKKDSSWHLLQLAVNFVIVMITPVIINRKAYLISLCTKLAFVPLVFFHYSETTNLTLESH